MQHLQIDFKAVRLYFKELSKAFNGDKDQFIDALYTMSILIRNEWEQA